MQLTLVHDYKIKSHFQYELISRYIFVVELHFGHINKNVKLALGFLTSPCCAKA